MERRKKRIKLWVSLVAMALMLVYALFGNAGNLQPSGAPGPTMKTLDEVEPRIAIHAVDLPLTITEPGSYYLVEDVNFTDMVNAITVECNDVTIDLMGYTLKGPNSGSYSGVYMNGRKNVEIRNGTIRDFSYGIIEADSVEGKGHRVIGIRAVSNGTDGIFLYGKSHLVEDCTAAENSVRGIRVWRGCTVVNSTSYENQHGIAASFGCTVRDNSVYNNQSLGIDACGGSQITGNTVYDNSGTGIYVIDGSSIVNGNAVYSNTGHGIYANYGCSITDNTVYENFSGGIFTGWSCMVAENKVYGNNQSDTGGYAGIRVSQYCHVKGNTVSANKQHNVHVYIGNAVEGNMVANSDGNGIYFDGNGNFYANNRATENGTDYVNTAGQIDGGGNVSF